MSGKQAQEVDPYLQLVKGPALGHVCALRRQTANCEIQVNIGSTSVNRWSRLVFAVNIKHFATLGRRAHSHELQRSCWRMRTGRSSRVLKPPWLERLVADQQNLDQFV